MAKTIATNNGFTLIKTAAGDYHITDNRKDKWGGLVSVYIDFSEHYGRYMGHVEGARVEEVIQSRDLHDCWLMCVAKCEMFCPEAA